MSSMINNASGTFIRVPDGVHIQGVVTDPFTWGWLSTMAIVGPILLFTLIGVIAWYLYDLKVRTPLEAHVVKECSLKKMPLEILEGDSGYLEFKAGVRQGSEGAITTKKEGKYLKSWTGFLPRQSSNRKMLIAPIGADEDVQKEVATTNALAEQLSNATVERRVLRGAKVAVNLGYKGKAILTNIKSIATLKTLDLLTRMEEDAMIYINLGALKALFNENWNTSQITANEEDREQIGFQRAKKMAGKESWIMALIGIGIFFGGLAAVIAVAYYLK